MNGQFGSRISVVALIFSMISTMCCASLVNVANALPGIQVHASGCRLHDDVARRLEKIVQQLSQNGLGVKVVQGYISPNANHVSIPHRDRHARGVALNCTLIRLNDGKELLMPTAVNHVAARSYYRYVDVPFEEKRNRQLLREVMLSHGFEQDGAWWHFVLSGWRDYPVIG